MVVRSIILILYFLTLLACSNSAADSAGNIDPTPPVGTLNRLAPIAFSNNLLINEGRILSYSKLSGRIGIIDPLSKTEVWGTTVTDHDYAVALPNLTGATLFADDHLTVVSENSSQQFSVPPNYVHTAAAKNNAAYSLSSADGGSLYVVRFLSQAQWQQQQFILPWPLEGVTQHADNLSLLISLFNDDGDQLMAFRPADGQFAVFEAPATNMEMASVEGYCEGDGSGIAETHFYSLAWHEQNGVYLAGSHDGRVYIIDTAVPCIAMDQRPYLQLDQAVPVVHLNVYDDGSLGAGQFDGQSTSLLSLIQFDPALETQYLLHTTGCDYPLGSTRLAAERIMIICNIGVIERSEDNDYFVYDMSSGTQIQRIFIENANTAGIAVDAENELLYQVMEGAFGNLNILDLITGDRETVSGVYLQGILNK